MAAIRAKGIAFGVIESAVSEAVEQRRYGENVCVARWKPPVNGVDGTIEYYFKKESTFKPIEDENGNVDYKNLGLVRNIYHGTPIAKITPPTEGTPGTDIMGKPVAQKHGVPAKFSVGKGTELVNDGTEIIASVDGNLVYTNGSFCIEESLLIRGDVDVSSGNIDFIGDIMVKGNVMEGFSVTSKKNVTIFGTVTNGTVTADGNITIKLGSINSKLHSEKGSIKLDFCQNSSVWAAFNVEASSFIGGDVYAGKKLIASGKGILVGGKYTALEDISASVIGSDNYTKTMITLGNNAVLSEEMEGHKHKVAELEDKLDQLGKIVTTLTEMAKVSKLSPQREQMKVEAMRPDAGRDKAAQQPHRGDRDHPRAQAESVHFLQEGVLPRRYAEDKFLRVSGERDDSALQGDHQRQRDSNDPAVILFEHVHTGGFTASGIFVKK